MCMFSRQKRPSSVSSLVSPQCIYWLSVFTFTFEHTVLNNKCVCSVFVAVTNQSLMLAIL